MARISLGICMLLVVASSVIYEAQGTFLLKLYLRKKFPARCSDFTPFANKGMLMLVTNLEGGCPATAEFKDFFAKFKDYMTFFETAQATSKNIDVEMKTKADGLFSAMSVLNGGQGGKSADAGSFKSTMLSMGKTLVEQKKSTKMMTFAQKKELIVAMVKWTRMLATFVKTASEKKGKSINISSYGLDVDVNDKSIGSGTSTSSGSFSAENESSSSTEKASSSAKFESSGKKGAVAGSSENTPTKKKESTGVKTESASSDKKADAASSGKTSSKKEESSGAKTEIASSDKKADAASKGKTSSKNEESSGAKTESASLDKKGAASKKKEYSGKSFKDTTGGNSGSPNGSPTGSPSSSTSAAGKTSDKGSASASVKQVESETSKEVMTFITDLEKKYSGKAELKVFFEKLKASMTASSTISSKSAKDYVSGTRAAAGKLSEAMNFVGSKKSAKMKSNMETSQDKLMRTLKELQDINTKIMNEKTVTSTQQTELKQTITKWEQVTTEFVETATSSSSSSYSSQQNSDSSQQSSTSSKQSSASSQKS